jgi:ribosome maturation factor RimP
MRLSPLEERIAKLIEPTLAGLGYSLVCVQENGEGIQIFAENPLTGALGMEDCTKISRAVGAVLDVEDPIERAYRLEVSSPGVDRLLIKEKDYADHLGLEAKVELEAPNENGQKKFRGRISGVEDNTARLMTEDQGEVTFPLSAVKKAKLVMNDELIKVTQERFKKLRQQQEDSTNEEVEDHGTAASR